MVYFPKLLPISFVSFMFAYDFVITVINFVKCLFSYLTLSMPVPLSNLQALNFHIIAQLIKEAVLTKT